MVRRASAGRAALAHPPFFPLKIDRSPYFTRPRLPPLAVLRAIGVEEENAHTSIRFGIGRFTTEAEVDHTIALTVKHVKRLREMSPLWEMVQEGVDLKTIEWTGH